MMLNVKKLLAYILDSFNHKALLTTWYAVSTTVGEYTTVKTFTLKANSAERDHHGSLLGGGLTGERGCLAC